MFWCLLEHYKLHLSLLIYTAKTKVHYQMEQNLLKHYQMHKDIVQGLQKKIVHQINHKLHQQIKTLLNNFRLHHLVDFHYRSNSMNFHPMQVQQEIILYSDLQMAESYLLDIYLMLLLHRLHHYSLDWYLDMLQHRYHFHVRMYLMIPMQ